MKVKDTLTLTATDKCLIRVPSMNVNVSENIYEMICKSRWNLNMWG